MAARTVHPSVRVGDTFDRWTVIGAAEPKIYYGRPFRHWLCRCACKAERVVQEASLVGGGTRSCGCLRIELARSANTIHGATGRWHRAPEYIAWINMIARCYKPSSVSYERYGARGVEVCNRWRFGEGGKTGFQCFYEDMGPRPSDQHSNERIKNALGYRPGNCKWATRAEQARNTSQNRWLTWDGRTLTVRDWATEIGMSPTGLVHRLNRGWSVERALSTPPDTTRIAHATMRRKMG